MCGGCLVRKKNAFGIFFSSGFLLQYQDAGKGSKYWEFYDLSCRITCMVRIKVSGAEMVLGQSDPKLNRQTILVHVHAKEHIQKDTTQFLLFFGFLLPFSLCLNKKQK